MRRVKYIFLSVLLLIIIGISYYKHVIYVNKLKDNSIILRENIESFKWNYVGLFPKTKSDLIRVLSWNKRVSSGNSFDLDIDKVRLKYNKQLNEIIVYYIGNDNVDNNLLYTPLNRKNSFEIKYLSLFDYFFNFFKSYDVILVKLKIPTLECNYLLEYILNDPHFEVFLKSEYQGNEEKYFSDFKKKINNFNKEFNNSNSEISNLKTYVMIKNDSINFLCNNIDLTPDEKKMLINRLKVFFNENKIDYFEYAMFPIKG